MQPRLVIGLVPGADPARVARSLRDLGVTAGPTAHPTELPRVLEGQLQDGEVTDEVIARIEALDEVEYANRWQIMQGFDEPPEV